MKTAVSFGFTCNFFFIKRLNYYTDQVLCLFLDVGIKDVAWGWSLEQCSKKKEKSYYKTLKLLILSQLLFTNGFY